MFRGRHSRVLFALVVVAGPRAQQPEATTEPPSLPQVRLVGRIVSVTHESIPAAEVWATNAVGKVLGRTIADGDGFYQLSKLPAGALRLHAKAEGQVPGQIEVEAHGRIAAVTLPLEDGRPLSGTVVAADGKPVAGIPVLVVPVPELQPPFAWLGEAVTDQDGAWSLPAVPLRRLKVRAFAPGHALSDVAVEREAATVPVRLVADPRPPRRIRVQNWPSGAKGVVFMEPKPDKLQRVFRLPRNLAETEVDTDGAALLGTMTRSHEVRVAVPGYRTMPVLVSYAEGTSKDYDFELIPRDPDELAPSTALHGRVQDELGRPLAGIIVVGRSHGRDAVPVRSAADGTFQMRMPARAGVLSECSIHSDVWCIGDPRAKLERDGRCWITGNTDPEQLIVLHALPSGVVSGVLRGPTGTPLAAANVQLRLQPQQPRKELQPPVAAATDLAGRLLVSGLPPGSYVLTAVGAGLLPASVDVVVSSGGTVEPAPLHFPPVGEVRGVVTDGAGASVGGALLGIGVASHRGVPAWVRRSSSAATIGGVVLADRRGRFRVPGIGTGDRWICVDDETEDGPPAGHEQSFSLGENDVVELELRR